MESTDKINFIPHCHKLFIYFKIVNGTQKDNKQNNQNIEKHNIKMEKKSYYIYSNNCIIIFKALYLLDLYQFYIKIGISYIFYKKQKYKVFAI